MEQAYLRKTHVYRAWHLQGLEKNNRAWHNPKELPRQIQLLRKYPTIQGSIYFSSKTFYRNPNGWNDSLQNNYYRRLHKFHQWNGYQKSHYDLRGLRHPEMSDTCNNWCKMLRRIFAVQECL
ncbi:MAG: hypothetical protein M3352_02740 [Bacteroidota bacterium]|nr:hypothetical protein [Bacteroidota bacterium]